MPRLRVGARCCALVSDVVDESGFRVARDVESLWDGIRGWARSRQERDCRKLRDARVGVRRWFSPPVCHRAALNALFSMAHSDLIILTMTPKSVYWRHQGRR